MNRYSIWTRRPENDSVFGRSYYSMGEADFVTFSLDEQLFVGLYSRPRHALIEVAQPVSPVTLNERELAWQYAVWLVLNEKVAPGIPDP